VDVGVCVCVGVYSLYAAFTKECGKSVRPKIFACLVGLLAIKERTAIPFLSRVFSTPQS